ncbi:MAG: hypothetical protein Q4F72_12590, partial [Desulfovibrionaceae bacterium]|nr:hypothetical protein [Desulfovibrionaceae bacterium]
MTLLRKHDSTPSSVPFTDPAAAGFALPPAAGLLGTLFRSASPTAASRPAGRSGSAQPGHAQPVCRAGAALLLAASLGAGAGLGTFLAMTPEEAFASYEEHLAAPAHGGASSLVEPAAPLSAQPAGLVMRGRPDPAQRTESRGINMPADHALPLMVPAGWICQGAAPAGTGTLSWERDEDWSAVMERLALAGSCRIQVDWDNRLIIVERAAPAATSSASAASGTGRAGMPGAQGAAGAS